MHSTVLLSRFHSTPRARFCFQQVPTLFQIHSIPSTTFEALPFSQTPGIVYPSPPTARDLSFPCLHFFPWHPIKPLPLWYRRRIAFWPIQRRRWLIKSSLHIRANLPFCRAAPIAGVRPAVLSIYISEPG